MMQDNGIDSERARDTAQAYYERAAYLTQQGQYKEALRLSFVAQELVLQSLGESELMYAWLLNIAAEAYRGLGQNDEAERNYKRANEVVLAVAGDHHSDYAIGLNNLGSLYLETGRANEGISLLEQALQLQAEIEGETNIDYAIALHNLATAYHKAGLYEEALRRYQHSMEIVRETVGENDVHYATGLTAKAQLYADMGLELIALELFQEVEAIFRNAVGESHPYYHSTLIKLGDLYASTGSIEQAITTYQRVYQIRVEEFGPLHPKVESIRERLLALYRRTGNMEALSTLDQLSDPEPEEPTLSMEELITLQAQYSQAFQLRSQGDPEAAVEIGRQILSELRDRLGDFNPTVAESLSLLGGWEAQVGDFEEARAHLQYALEMWSHFGVEDHPHYAAALYHMAGVEFMTGHYAEAQESLLQVITIQRETLGVNDPSYATSLNTLARIHMASHQYDAAAPLVKQAMEIRRSVLGEDHPHYASSLVNLARLEFLQQDYESAEEHSLQALKIFRETVGASSPLYASVLNNLAVYYMEQGRYDEAEEQLGQSVSIEQQYYGDVHPETVIGYYNWGVLNVAMGQPNQALEHFQQFIRIQDRLIGVLLSISSEHQRLNYLGNLSWAIDVFSTLILRHFPENSSAILAGLELILRRKALGAEAASAQRSVILSGHYPQQASELRRLQRLKEKIARKTLSGPQGETTHRHLNRIADLTLERSQLEVDLASQIPEIKLEEPLLNASARNIAKLLPPDSALVEFIRINEKDFHSRESYGEKGWKAARYLAFVLPARQHNTPQMVDLGEAAIIDRLIANYRVTITHEVDGGTRRAGKTSQSPSAGEVQVTSDPVALRSVIALPTRNVRPVDWKSLPEQRLEQGVRLRQAVFDPLLQALGKYKRLFLAPDGNLAHLPFEVLPLDNDCFVIDEYEISYLSVGRDLQRFEVNTAVGPNQPLVVANPNFDMASETVADFEAGKPFSALDGTRGEGKQVAFRLGVIPQMADDAVEQVVKGCRSPQILHIATHGFFLQKRTVQQEKTIPFEGTLGNLNLIGNIEGATNPLLRSSLVLAGGNTYLQGGSLPSDADDGLLTAEDVTGIDLLGTKLVVLSACDTGRGEDKVGEGVFGLRRAFVLAGARALVMSLWKIPDDDTRILMEEFYRLVKDNQPVFAALREAQLMMKKRLLDAGEDPDPFFWGAFICQGDPGPIGWPDKR